MNVAARTALLVMLGAGALAACGAPRKPELHQFTNDLDFRISSDPQPPRAREKNLFKVVVADRQTGQPIEGGEGRIFATSSDGVNTWDALDPGPELGTYYGTMSFITSGDWAVAIQFRRDSTKPIERIDWMQTVMQPSDEPVQ